MAKAASYNTAGNREDLTDVLTILEPESTPFVSMAKKLPHQEHSLKYKSMTWLLLHLMVSMKAKMLLALTTKPLTALALETMCRSSADHTLSRTYRNL